MNRWNIPDWLEREIAERNRFLVLEVRGDAIFCPSHTSTYCSSLNDCATVWSADYL